MRAVMTKQEMLDAAKEVNKEALDVHMAACRPKVAELEKELYELRALIANTGIEYEPGKYTTLELILAYPQHYGAYEICRKDGCREIDPHEHTEVRRWWE